jgi:hypothetical protein
VSCTLALAVAGALAAVTVGSAFVFDLLPGSSSGSDGAADVHSTARPTPAAPPQGTVPAAFIGTWEGEGLALNGTLPSGTFRVTVRQAETGEQFATVRQTDLLGGVCDDVLILKKATEKEIVAISRAKKTNDSHCTTGDHTVWLRPVGDDLRYESDNPDAGDPEARMSRLT